MIRYMDWYLKEVKEADILQNANNIVKDFFQKYNTNIILQDQPIHTEDKVVFYIKVYYNFDVQQHVVVVHRALRETIAEENVDKA